MELGEFPRVKAMGPCLPRRQDFRCLAATPIVLRSVRPPVRLVARLDSVGRLAAAAAAVVPRVIPGRTTPAAAAVEVEEVDLLLGRDQAAVAAEDIRPRFPLVRAARLAVPVHRMVDVDRLAVGETTPSTGPVFPMICRCGTSGRPTWSFRGFLALRDSDPG